MNRTVVAWLALLLIVMGGTGLAMAIKYSLSRQAASGSDVAEIDLEYRKLPESAQSKWLTDFTLTERSGRLLGSAELRGRVHVVNFFFCSCPQSCLQQNKTLETVQRVYGPRGVQFVGITCDPETDSPSMLRDYANRHFPQAGGSWWFLTGDLLYIRRIAGEIYQVPLDARTHTERFIVIDKWGNQRGQFHWSKPEELTDMRRMLDKLVAESAPPPDLPLQPSPPAATEASAAAPPSAQTAKSE